MERRRRTREIELDRGFEVEKECEGSEKRTRS